MMRRIIHNIFLGGSIVLLVFAVCFSLINQGANDTFIFGYKPFIIVSGSMEPEYPIHTLVMIKQINPEEISVNDTIAYYSEPTQVYVFHRVIEVRDQGLITKGDNNNAPDLAMVPFDAVMGRSVFHTTFTVYLFSLFRSPGRFIGFVLVPIGSLIIAKYTYKHAKKKARISL